MENDYKESHELNKNILFKPKTKFDETEELNAKENDNNNENSSLINLESNSRCNKESNSNDEKSISYTDQINTKNNHNANNNNKSDIIKNKKTIKKEYYKMKPNIIRQNNLRFVEPYEFEYQIYAKGRWIGRKLIEVLLQEFRQYNEEYFLNAIKDGNLKINKYLTNPTHILQRNDFITHKVIRKENPIIDSKLEIVFENQEFLVINKPSSWPVHVCGGYQFNTLHRILMDEYSYEDLKVLHRLDKPTSGIVIMAKDKLAAEYFRQHLHTDLVQKTYLCRVKGDFKWDKINCVRAIVLVNQAKGIYSDAEFPELQKVNQTLGPGEHYAQDIDVEEGYFENQAQKEKNKRRSKGVNFDKSGVNVKLEKNPDKEHESEDDEKNEPKYAETDFEKLFYDGKSNTSLVMAKPRTGRTHQIRIHLRYLGYPIANDPCYGGIVYNGLKDLDNPDFLKFHQIVPHLKSDKEKQTDENNFEANKTIEYREVLSASEVNCYKIWLHAFNYKFQKYEFETKYPDWAQKDYALDHKF